MSAATARAGVAGTVLDVNLNPAANGPAATTALDPESLIAGTKLRYQWADTNLVSIPATTEPAPQRPGVPKSEKVLMSTALTSIVATLAGVGLENATTSWIGFGASVVSTLALYLYDGKPVGTTLVVPANVSAAWNRVRSVTATYAHLDGAVAPGSLLELETGSWLAVEEIAAHVQSGTLASAECIAAMDALFTAAAQADTYDLLRKHATQLEPAHSPAAALLATSDIDGALALLAPAPVEPQLVPNGY